jgi:FdhD protein
MYREFPCLRMEEGTFVPSTHPVVVEASISLTVNGRNLMTAMASPHSLEEFVIGFLFTEQIIHDIQEIESIQREKDTFRVLTKNPFRVLGQKKIILSGCGGSSSYLDARRLPHISSSLRVPPETIRSAMREVMDSPLHRLTGGVHVVGLYSQGSMHIEEDIGRHNALDKVIGHALRNHIPREESFVVSSGRISSEMIRKCLIAGIPLIVSRGAATSLALEMAEKTGLCVVGFARGDRMNIYTHPARVEGVPLTTG